MDKIFVRKIGAEPTTAPLNSKLRSAVLKSPFLLDVPMGTGVLSWPKIGNG